ncbi:G5 domain-containing protein [Actinomadura opuntiae]|uniref:G5 domain-containing protein n=1 Tax=Actinomadura sp. OS1-43 TaxID=604315 RepID=UPI00255B21BD|nr:G5 domain-containing protein [Actinomadura sp. OS1-43]MDL4814278.1 G5 domain-containing protein [Actinomadura sp. OS1-43]
MRYFTLVALAVCGLLTLNACKTDPSPSAAASPISSAAASASPAASTAATPTASSTKKTVTVTRKIPFGTTKVRDSSLAKGTTKVKRRGVTGIKKLTYEVTLTDGVQTRKKLIRQKVTKAPVEKVIAVGTRQASRCDPNYSGACVPIASDVDCAGGSGNGPGYVQGPVRVVGSDIYDLDRDGDGIGCDT